MSTAKKVASLLLSVAVLFALSVFLSAPERYAESVLNGISLWAASVLPAAFPFLFLTALFTGLKPFAALSGKISPVTGKVFRVSGAGGGAAMLAALSGYPVGARMLFDLKSEGRISDEETFRLACLCTTSGPNFLVGTVGSMMLGNTKAGWILLLAHLLSVWIVCFCLRFTAKGKFISLPPPPKKRDDLLYESLYGAVISVLCVGGFIALFACFGQMLCEFGLFKGLAALTGGDPVLTEGVCRGLLEMTTGVAVLSGLSGPLPLAISCALVTFGGVCVLCQQAAYLTRAGVKMLPFLAVKAIQAILAFGLCYLLVLAFQL